VKNMIGLICMNDSKDNMRVSCNSSDYLDLPDCPDFESYPPDISLAANIKICEEMLPVWNKKRFESKEHMTVWEEEFYL